MCFDEIFISVFDVACGLILVLPVGAFSICVLVISVQISHLFPTSLLQLLEKIQTSSILKRTYPIFLNPKAILQLNNVKSDLNHISDTATIPLYILCHIYIIHLSPFPQEGVGEKICCLIGL